MIKPQNWENTQAYGDFERLESGGYICKIMKVEETKSRGNKDMLVISIDIARGAQKDFFANAFRNDTRETKKWGCCVYQLVLDNDGNTNKGYKTFIEAVKKSNPGFDETKLWEKDGTEYLKGKLVGGVFGREQYLKKNGEAGWSTKCMQFRDVAAIEKGVEIPEDKYLVNAPKPKRDSLGVEFEEIISDDDLPF